MEDNKMKYITLNDIYLHITETFPELKNNISLAKISQILKELKYS